jgi:hypothetical protein
VVAEDAPVGDDQGDAAAAVRVVLGMSLELVTPLWPQRVLCKMEPELPVNLRCERGVLRVVMSDWDFCRLKRCV